MKLPFKIISSKQFEQFQQLEGALKSEQKENEVLSDKVRGLEASLSAIRFEQYVNRGFALSDYTHIAEDYGSFVTVTRKYKGAASICTTVKKIDYHNAQERDFARAQALYLCDLLNEDLSSVTLSPRKSQRSSTSQGSL